MTTLRAALAVLAFMPVAPTMADQSQPGTGHATPGVCTATEAAFCKTSCAPRNLVFLPCMAVGATNMARCREREVAACLQACVSRRCS